MGLMLLRHHNFRALFRQRQRLQIGYSDSNRCELAEYLKVGCTSLVMDMTEAGALPTPAGAAPPRRGPESHLADPTLQVEVELKDGRKVTALEIQHIYQRAADAFVQNCEPVSLEARQLVQLWGETLDALERDPGTLIGRIDWVTKRALIESMGDASVASRKKLDLKYHELGSGYFDALEHAGLTLSVVPETELRKAMTLPPQNTRARLRTKLMAALEEARIPFNGISWDSVRIGGAVRGKVLRLADYRDQSDRRLPLLIAAAERQQRSSGPTNPALRSAPSTLEQAPARGGTQRSMWLLLLYGDLRRRRGRGMGR